MTTDDWYIEVNYGLTHDGHFIKFDQLDEFARSKLDVECYTSMFRYPTPDIHIGALLAGFGMDFDCADNPEKARKEAVAVTKYLIGKFNMQEQDFSICFSGCKGVHIFINRHVLDIQPHAGLPYIFKEMAKQLIVECNLKTLDLKIYIQTAFIRLINSRHPHTGLYKIPLTYVELETMHVDKIKALAGHPRPRILTKLTHVKNEAAAAWYEHVKTAYLKKLEDKRLEFAIDQGDFAGDLLPCVKEQLEQGARTEKRNATAWQLATYFLRHGEAVEQCLALLKPWYEKCDQPPKAKWSMPWEDVEKTVHATYNAGGYGIGCGSEFAEGHCIGKDKCPIFKAQGKTETFSAADFEAAETHLKDAPIKFIVDTVNLIHVGDAPLIGIAYISALSAALGMPIHLWPIGTSQKGKSHVLYQILKVLPQSMYEQYTSASPKSLFYICKQNGEDFFDGKLIYIDEVESSKLTLPLLRTLTSQTEIDPRHLSVYDAEVLDLRIKGRRAVWFTSIKPFGAEQLRNRFIFVNPDETENQDDAVHKWQLKDSDSKQPDPDTFRVAQAMTQKIVDSTKEIEVDIPYLQHIKWPFKNKRWLFPIFKRFIKLSAKIHHQQRQTKDSRIQATAADFCIAKTYWKTFEKHIIYRTSTPAQTLLDNLGNDPLKLSKADLAKATGYSTKHVGRLLEELSESELINMERQAGSRGFVF